MDMSAVERQLFIFEDLKAFMKKDKKHDSDLNDKYFERSNDNALTALFLDGYGFANMLTMKADKSTLDKAEKELKERGYDKGRFADKHFIRSYMAD